MLKFFIFLKLVEFDFNLNIYILWVFIFFSLLKILFFLLSVYLNFSCY